MNKKLLEQYKALGNSKQHFENVEISKAFLEIMEGDQDQLKDGLNWIKYKGALWPVKIKADIEARGGLNGKGTSVTVFLKDFNLKPLAKGYQGPASINAITKIIKWAASKNLFPNKDVKESISTKTTPDKHQLKIAIDTVKNLSKGLLGGMDAKESEEILKNKFKYTNQEIKKLKNEDSDLTLLQRRRIEDAEVTDFVSELLYGEEESKEIVENKLTEKAGDPLTLKNIKPGILIKSKEEPGWGTFVVQDQYDKGSWNIRGDRGVRVLSAGEFKFWELAK